jgi:hypothetical protein
MEIVQMRIQLAAISSLCWFMPILIGIFSCLHLPQSHFRQKDQNSKQIPTVLTIAYTNDTDGYLQSCGCTSNQAGGLARRAHHISKLRIASHQQGSAFLLLDGGNLAKDMATAEAVVSSMEIMRYDAIASGLQDEKLGIPLFDLCRRVSIPLLSLSNISHQQTESFALFNQGKLRVAVISIPDLPVERIASLLHNLVSDLRKKYSDVLILGFSHLNFERERSLLAMPSMRGLLQVVVGRRGDQNRNVSELAGTILLPVCVQGEIGVVEFTAGEKGGVHLTIGSVRHHLESMYDIGSVDKEVERVVRGYFEKQANLLRDITTANKSNGTSQSFASVERCADCHAEETKQWQKSKHAIAAQTLRLKEKLVPQCLSCHNELFRRTKTFDVASSVAWQGVTCTTCHGDGVLHSALRTKDSIQRKVNENICRTCHDSQNDPHFEMASYRKKIQHWHTEKKNTGSQVSPNKRR